MSAHTTRSPLDATDPLTRYRDLFVGSETDTVYLDGNSLGRPLRATVETLERFARGEWGGRLIQGWDEGWLELGERLGDRLGAACLGAAPGQTIVADSTSVLIHKLLHAAVAMRPDRSDIVVDPDDFPTDRFLAQAVAEQTGRRVRAGEADERTAVVLRSLVDFRTAELLDGAAATASAHESGALVIWDLSHAAGVVPVALDEWGVDFAVGCTYKYLNGGPGSPAFTYVGARHLEALQQPIPGWLGHADPFAFASTYEPATGIRRLVSGTPPVLAMQPLIGMLDVIEEAGVEAIRVKSRRLGAYAQDLAQERLAQHGVTVIGPAEAERRGGHLSLAHPEMSEVRSALMEQGVVTDFRPPDVLRLGMSPLSTSFEEVERGIDAIASVLGTSR